MTEQALSSTEGPFPDVMITWEEIVRFAKQLDNDPRLSSTDARVLVRLVLRFQSQLVEAKGQRRRALVAP
jgi:hypothetical protein